MRAPEFISIRDNLSPRFPVRDYQYKCFTRFDYFLNNDFTDKQQKPFHLLYNMATGSGKTLIMSGLILYLYEKGYRNFLFFVNSTNIIRKTRGNFLESTSSKYLFAPKIRINGQVVSLKECDSFESADEHSINIKFTTIQQLHTDLNDARENSITYEDLKDRKIVLFADEAHHLNSSTRKGHLFGSWEGTVLEILKQNRENILLEFTATLDLAAPEIASKYRDKLIFKYDLAQFRIDKYSKEINLVRSRYDEKERILQALILNLYRQELAASRKINLKPVILFKAKRTIRESEQNKTNFHALIHALSAVDIDKVKETSTISVIRKAFAFFEKWGLNSTEIAGRLKSSFREENCLSANNDQEAELNQLRLNTLEDTANPIRAIFAVQKLNEGWDVLNLFDIVRLYEDRDGKEGQPGKTTLSEAQLIGRGARYFPFSMEEGEDKYTRKFDNDIDNDLKILEELYYHTKEDSRYISELKKALVISGIYEDEDRLVCKMISLKPEFMETEFYKTARVMYNSRIKKSYNGVRSFSDLGVSKTNYLHLLSSGLGRMTGAFSESDLASEIDDQEKKDIMLKELPRHIVRYALSQNPFFYFNNLVNYFPELRSLSEFIENPCYLASLSIIFVAPKERIGNLTNQDLFFAVMGLLQVMEAEIKSNLVEYEGSKFSFDFFHRVFPTEKVVRFLKDPKREEGQKAMLANRPWYPYDANYGTSEERAFVEMFDRKVSDIGQSFSEIYLVRNERVLKVYDKQGRALEPDYVLLCKQKNAQEERIFQVYIEPKGSHLIPLDKWKEDFLMELNQKRPMLQFNTEKHLLTAIPFYNFENENETIRALEETLELKSA
ncbi:MAG: DEAD/DEAH box helicase family protein [Bacteroidota bacterium]